MNTAVTTPLSPGTHTVNLERVAQRYHVAGTGPVCLAHPGGPGLSWEYLRMPAAEEHLTMVYVEPIGTGASGRLPAHPHGYTRERYAQALDGLIRHLGVARVHLLGHSHGGFVAPALRLDAPRPARRRRPVRQRPGDRTEHFAERRATWRGCFAARRNAGRPGLRDVLDAWESLGGLADDEAVTLAARGLLPAYLADYWDHQEEYASLFSVTGTYISGLDDRRVPDAIDDRAMLGSFAVRGAGHRRPPRRHLRPALGRESWPTGFPTPSWSCWRTAAISVTSRSRTPSPRAVTAFVAGSARDHS
ncbi:alpha/beta hydrolase [Nonomuraea dietziae]|uniref:alpha/beta fold hydrolase n=1 Tax=Nonomuraea dietziae TaxID=65515 RepID=UPI0031D8C27E